MLHHPAAEQSWEQQQERNLLYVALTRAKKRLVFVGEPPRGLPADYQPEQGTAGLGLTMIQREPPLRQLSLFD